MIVKAVGKEYKDYFSEKAQRQIQGFAIHYFAEKSGVEGHFCDRLFVDKAAPLFKKLQQYRITEPVEVEAVYDMVPGNPYPQLVDIIFPN